MRNPRFRQALGRLVLLAPLLVCGPVLVVQGLVTHSISPLLDFRYGLYNAGVAILHGAHFYEPRFLANQAAVMRAGGIGRGELSTNEFSIPVYPAFANVAVVPLALLPLWAAATLFTLASTGAMLGGLRLLGVRDWRCLGLALLSWPFLFAAVIGAVGPLLVLGAGIAWRWRHRIWPPAAAVGSLVAIKIFPWTLGAWLLVTRRYRTLAVAVGVCVVLTLGAWALIGFQDILQYPQMLSNLSLLQEGRGVSVVTVAVIAGASPRLASVIAIAVGAAILALAWRLARGEDGDRRAFGLAIIAALATTPIVWEHYMVLLFVPVALASPRFSRLWLAPLASPVMVAASRAVFPTSHRVQAYSPDELRQALSWLLIETVVGFCLCTTRQSRAALRARLRARRRPRLRLAPAAALDES